MKELQVGVIGLGLGRHFVKACEKSAIVGRLVVCDPDAERRAEAKASMPGIDADYESMDGMLNSEKLDAVCVVTPDHMHRPHVERCLSADCHVLMTKPLATTLEDGRAIIRAEIDSGKTVMVAHERRYRSRYKEIKRLITEGRLGDIVLIQANQLSDRRGQFTNAPWYASPEAGRTALVGSGIHEVDLIRFLVGERIVTVSACSNRIGDLAFPKSKTTATVFQFENGSIGQTAISYEVRWPDSGKPEAHFLLAGSRGVVLGKKVKLDEGDWIDLPGDEVEIATGCGGSVDAFLQAVVAGRPAPISTRDAYATLAACIAADDSAASGSTVVPDDADFGLE